MITQGRADEVDHALAVMAVASDALRFDALLQRDYGDDSATAGRALAGQVRALGRPDPVNLDMLDASGKSIALALARVSRHPLSQALRRALESEAIKAAAVDGAAETPGAGVEAMMNGQRIRLGRPEAQVEDGRLACALSVGDAEPVTILFEDALRPDVRESLSGLAATAHHNHL